MSRFRTCPFCKKEVDGNYPYIHFNEVMGKWIFSHYCEHPDGQFHVTIDIYGFTEQDCIDKWNGVYEDEESESL